ncbi:MAG: DUF5662 family protein [Armatimonadia bacterium]
MSLLSKLLLALAAVRRALAFLVSVADWRNAGPTLRYAWLTAKHKWFVLVIGRKFGCSWRRLLAHDLSKFSPAELPHYGRQFFGAKDDPAGFVRCWLHHQNRNDHHWEWWIPRTGHNRCTPPYPDGHPLVMTEGACREMVADWAAAGRAYEGRWPDLNSWTWLEKNFARLDLHLETRAMVLAILREANGGCMPALAAAELGREMATEDK